MFASIALFAAALAQPVSAVPAGSQAVTVFVCARVDACGREWRALSAHAAGLGLPVLDFDAVAAAVADDPRGTLDATLARLREGHGKAGETLIAELGRIPATIAADDLFLAWMHTGIARHAAGDRDEGDAAFRAAASVSGGRVHDLPPMPEATLRRYVELAGAPVGDAVTVEIAADAPGARVWVDGRAAGDAPVVMPVRPGWHRINVERPGRRAAWTATIDARTGAPLTVWARVADDDGRAALEAAVAGELHGVPAGDEVAQRLAGWAAANGLRHVRFVELRAPGDPVPEERVVDTDPRQPGWDVHSVYLDVPARRFRAHGPGPAAMQVAGVPDRFRVGVAAGYLHLAEREDTDGIPAHDHATVALVASWRVRPLLALEARVGLAHAAQPYYLDEDWQDRNVFPVALGARIGRAEGGPTASVSALAVVPLALGGEVRAGWEFAPASAWRIAPEVVGGVTDRGWTAGGELRIARRQ